MNFKNSNKSKVPLSLILSILDLYFEHLHGFGLIVCESFMIKSLEAIWVNLKNVMSFI